MQTLCINNQKIHFLWFIVMVLIMKSLDVKLIVLND